MANMGAGVPLLNDYKLEFFWKRFPQTLFGGLRLKLRFCGPAAYVYINQLVLFFTPWLIGGIFTVLVEKNILKYDIATYIVGAIMFLYVMIVNISAVLIKLRSRKIRLIRREMKIISEEDEVEFDSCCGPKSTSFTVPGKKFKFNIFFHSLISGIVCALSFWYLLPSTLNTLYNNNLAATIVLYILGWITLLISQHSLTVLAPPEPATYRTQDSYETTPLMRHFYITICVSFHLLARVYPVFHLTDQVLHIVFVFLPLLWTLGLLPPLDALFLWILEQSLVFIFGGSAMASDLGLVLMILASTATLTAEILLPHGVGTICMMAGTGYVLSIDLSTLSRQLLSFCGKWKRQGDQLKSFLWRWTYKETLFHFGMTLTVTGLSGVTYNFSKSSVTLQNKADFIAYAVAGVLTIKVILSQLQSVYFFGGLFRNPAYPKSVQRITVFHKRKRKLNILGHIHRFLMNAAAPFLMLVYFSLSTSFPSDSSSAIFAVLGASRSFRWTWQNTPACMLDITILSIVKLVLASGGWFMKEPGGLQLLLISLCRDRTKQLLHKLFTWFTILLKSCSDPKQRRPSSLIHILLNILFFPIVLGILTVAAVISAPILPLFTLPVFLFGYPRTLKFWPEPVGTSASTCPDSVFYEHLVGRLTPVFQKGFASGSLGDASTGGMYLVRFQDRLVWVQVLERGYLYCCLSIKGLELQETSCHTVEASQIDEMFDEAFETGESGRCCFLNNNVFSILSPCDAAYLKTYSDAKNVLTGVIDSPEALKLISTGFVQALVWTLLHDVSSYDKVPEPYHSNELKETLKQHEYDDLNTKTPELATKNCESIEFRSISRTESQSSRTIKRLHSPSIKSLASSWSDDNESLILEPFNSGRVNLVKGLSTHRTLISMKSSMTPVEVVEDPVIVHEPVTARNITIKPVFDQGDVNRIDDLFNDSVFGVPVTDVEQPENVTSLQNPETFSLHPSTKFGALLSPPNEWLQFVEQQSQQRLTNLFPKAWFQHVLTLLPLGKVEDKDTITAIEEIQGDQGLELLYSHLVMSCYAAVNLTGLGTGDPISIGPSFVYKVFTGKIPWSPALDVLERTADLKKLILKAYRFAVKMAIDQIVMGEVESLEELQEYLQEYSENWYIGNDSDSEWEKSIFSSKQALFSLSHTVSLSTYHSRLLTLQDIPVYIGALNGEMVRSQWANLVLELLYLTNDDEERYSIQAHPAILRNLTVQAADPPLGYPVYSSPPLTVPKF